MASVIRQNEPLKPQPLYVSAEQLEREISRLERIESRTASVMVADDMQTMRLLLTQSLRGAGFEEVHRAADGETALRMMLDLNTDLAVVDWNMPRMDGLELLEAVRTNAELLDLVFIMVTAETLDAKVIQAAEEQQDAYLTKPISPEKLSRRLELILEKRLVTARSQLYEVKGESDLAVDLFIAAVHNRPSARWPLFGLGSVLFRLGRWKDAEKTYTRILELDQTALAAMVELGRVKEAGGDPQAAREIYLGAIRKSPQLFRAYDALAESLYRAGDLQAALEIVQGAMRAQGTEKADRQELMAQLLFGLNRPSEAEAAIQKAMALKPLRKQVSNNLALGKTRLAQKRSEEAIADFRQAYDPKSVGGSQRDRLDAMLLAGQTFLRKGRDIDADYEFRRMHLPHSWPQETIPFESKQLYREAGGVYLCEGRETQARTQFMYSVLNDGRDPVNLTAIKEICRGLGRDDLAAEDFGDVEAAKAAALVEAHSRQGLVLVSRGRLEEAEAEYLKGLAIDPHSGRLRFNLGKLRIRLKHFEQGNQDILEAARAGVIKGDWELVAEVARFFSSTGEEQKARTLLRQMLVKKPGQPILEMALMEIEQK
jgi:two-component system chemotaxis response regulator CheY